MSISRSIFYGIEEAHNSYSEMAGTWLWEGCEYYLTVLIAQRIKLAKIADWITLEEPVRNVYFQSGAGAPNIDIRINGRVDIALWEGDDGMTVPAVIEVKSSVSPSTCRNDFKRLCRIVTKTNKTEGYFAYYCSQEKPSEDNVISWLEKRAEDLKNEAEIITMDKTIKVVSTYEITKPEKFGDTFSSALFAVIRLHKVK